MTDNNNSQFNFNISLSVLDHLGRNLYRSFVTVLGEAISNAWDAEAENVWIFIDRDNNSFVIKDDGHGMSEDDFQNKFLKIGYSKRKVGQFQSPIKNRPYIGRKGIGKLALLSCAEKISIVSKITNSDYIGGMIDNSRLDQAITDDLTPQECPLQIVKNEVFEDYTIDHDQGTIVYFENIHNGIRNKLEYLRKIIALYFRFSLIDENFNIFLNNELVTVNDLKELADNTEFLWRVGELVDPYTKTLKELKEQGVFSKSKIEIKGFVASTMKPSHLNIRAFPKSSG